MPRKKQFHSERIGDTSYRRAYKKNDPNKRVETTNEFDERRINNIIDWTTFYRRNIHMFIEHYFGIKTYFVQKIWLYLMGVSDSFVAICSRGVGKTWLLGVFACARAVLYPRSKIVVCASTKEQAGLIVSEKISDLINDHPNLAREVAEITTNMNKWQVDFHNGSVITVVASKDSSRGKNKDFMYQHK